MGGNGPSAVAAYQVCSTEEPAASPRPADAARGCGWSSTSAKRAGRTRWSSLLYRSPGGHLGRRGLPYLTVFQILLPLAAPAVDVYAAYVLAVQPGSRTAAAWVALVVLQASTAAYALRLDGERFGPLWSLPLQQIVYRQMMYLVVVQAAVTALLGSRLGWHHVVRTGAAADLVGSRR